MKWGNDQNDFDFGKEGNTIITQMNFKKDWKMALNVEFLNSSILKLSIKICKQVPLEKKKKVRQKTYNASRL